MSQSRRDRKAALPDALRAAMARDCALIVHADAIDEARYDVFEVHLDASGVVVSRRCWWFDEEVQQWLLDDSSEWFLSPGEAMQLGAAIQQAGMPVASRKAG